MNMQCKLCNKEFEIGRLQIHLKTIHKQNLEEYYIKNINPNYNKKCLICNNKTKFISFKNGHLKTCGSKSCIAKLINLTSKEKQIEGCKLRNQKWKTETINGKTKQQIIIEKGQDKRNLKQKETNKKISKSLKENELISGDNNSMKNSETVQKLKLVFKEKYGVDWITQNKNIKEKIKQTMINKYEVNNYSKTKEYKNKMYNLNKEKMIERITKYFQENDLEFVSDINLYQNETTSIQFKCKKCGTIHTKIWNAIDQWWNCKVCNPNFSTSSQETEITEFLQSNNILFEKSAKIIKNPESEKSFEIDFNILNKNIAIEFDGLYWHCNRHQLNNNYHLQKTLLCKEKGIQLIHIFEDEWILKKEIVLSRLRSLLNLIKEKIFARKCKIKIVNFQEKNEFLEKNHIQGKDISMINIGLYYNNELVSIMTFSSGNISKGKKKEEGIWELNRFCNKINLNVIGGAGKLLSHFKKNYQWKEIYSYADKRWSTGNLYKKLNFNLEYETRPNYWYINLSKSIKRFHRFTFRKSMLIKMKEYKEELTEMEIMTKKGWNWIYDCGNLKFILKNV